MFLEIKKTILRTVLKLAPLLSKLLPQWLKNKLKVFIKTPEEKRTKLPYDANANPEGVNLFGYLKAQMGLGQGARLYARALQYSGLPHALLNFTAGNVAKHNDNEFSALFSKNPQYNTNIIHVNAEQFPMVSLDYSFSVWDKRYNIGIWLWELEEFPDEWANSYKYVDEIWTPSTFTSKNIAAKSPVPVTTIPYGIYADTDANFNRNHFHLPDDKFLFLCMYDINSMMERKNPVGAVNAFLQAFGDNNPDVGLVIKINNSNIHELSLLKRIIKDYKNIYLINAVMSKTEVNSLIQCCNSFISLHRSEGFGLVIAEAMYLGIPVIATHWSANTDFMNKENSCPVDFKFIDVGKNYYKAKPEQRWADPSEEHASQYMKLLINDQEYYKSIAQAGKETMLTQFSEKQCAQKMVDRLGKLGLISSFKTLQ